MRKRFRRRASIEPVISHMKNQYRMIVNYLIGSLGDAINILMSAAAFNFKSWMNKKKQKLFFALLQIQLILRFAASNIYFSTQIWLVKD